MKYYIIRRDPDGNSQIMAEEELANAGLALGWAISWASFISDAGPYFLECSDGSSPLKLIRTHSGKWYGLAQAAS